MQVPTPLRSPPHPSRPRSFSTPERGGGEPHCRRDHPGQLSAIPGLGVAEEGDVDSIGSRDRLHQHLAAAPMPAPLDVAPAARQQPVRGRFSTLRRRRSAARSRGAPPSAFGGGDSARAASARSRRRDGDHRRAAQPIIRSSAARAPPNCALGMRRRSRAPGSRGRARRRKARLRALPARASRRHEQDGVRTQPHHRTHELEQERGPVEMERQQCAHHRRWQHRAAPAAIEDLPVERHRASSSTTTSCPAAASAHHDPHGRLSSAGREVRSSKRRLGGAADRLPASGMPSGASLGRVVRPGARAAGNQSVPP